MPIFCRPLKLLLAASALALLVGCTAFQFPGVYKISVQQGNILTEEMLAQLEPGLTKRQVRFVLGTPLLEDSFNLNRWDYYYSLQEPNREPVQQHLVLFFDGDNLVRWQENLAANVDNAAGSGLPDADVQAQDDAAPQL